MQYRGEFLHAFMNTERLKSHKPVELQRGSDHFTADSMDFDNVEQLLQLDGRVHGTLVPAPQK
jgi:lipopolysaccharide export system protein LptC